jgi:hypothetical protein
MRKFLIAKKDSKNWLDMGRKIFLSISILMLICLILLPSEIADANMIPHPSTPSTELPTIDIQEYLPACANDSLELSFRVTQPSSWDSYYNGFMPIVGACHVYVYLDEIGVDAFPSTQTLVNNYTVVFNNLNSHQHTARIDIVAYALSKIGDYKSNISQTILFSINADSKTISVQENPPIITREPYPSPPPPTLKPISKEEAYTYLTVTFLIILVSVLSFSVYLKKKSLPNKRFL